MSSHLLLTAALITGLVACDTSSSVPGEFPTAGEVVFTVDGQDFTRPMLDTVIRGMPEPARESIEAAGIDALRPSLIASEMLYREAIDNNLHQDTKVREDIAMHTRRLLAEAQVERTVEQRLTDEMVSQWYEDHKVQFIRPQVKLAHIMLPQSQAARAVELRTELEGGADFAELASTHSMDPATASAGGDLGWLDLQQLQPDLKGALTDQEPGAIVGPLDFGASVHIFKIEETRESTPLEDVGSEIETRLKAQLAEEYMEDLLEKANVADPSGDAQPVDAVPLPADPGSPTPVLPPPAGDDAPE